MNECKLFFRLKLVTYLIGMRPEEVIDQTSLRSTRIRYEIIDKDYT